MKYKQFNDKENSDFHYEEHLRFSTSSYGGRSSIDSGDYDKNTRKICGGSNYNHNKRMSRTSNMSRGSNGTKRQSLEKHQSRSKNHHESSDNVIALFGASGVTGHYFLKFALEAGYQVRALVLPGLELNDMEGNENLTLVTGTFDDESKIHRVVRKASYVVCMLNDCENTLRDNSSPINSFEFIQILIPIMEKCQNSNVLLYQVRCAVEMLL